MTAGALLAVIALVLFIVALLPQVDIRLVAVAGILLSIAVLVGGTRLHLG